MLPINGCRTLSSCCGSLGVVLTAVRGEGSAQTLLTRASTYARQKSRYTFSAVSSLPGAAESAGALGAASSGVVAAPRSSSVPIEQSTENLGVVHLLRRMAFHRPLMPIA